LVVKYLTLQYFLLLFHQAEVFFALTLLTEARPTGTMAFVAKKIFLTQRPSVNIAKDFRASSSPAQRRHRGMQHRSAFLSIFLQLQINLAQRRLEAHEARAGAFTVISENSTKKRTAHRREHRLALPSDKSMYGYLSEHHSFGETEEVAGEYAKNSRGNARDHSETWNSIQI